MESSELDMPPKGAARRGLLRLMLRLPGTRSELDKLTTGEHPLDSLFEAYEDVAVTLERLRRDGRAEDAELLSEYEVLAPEIETEVKERCKAFLGSGPR